MADVNKAFKARFGGRCDACGEKIEEGQWVLYDEEQNLVHVDCADTEAEPDE